jgi:hypothetical protein
MRPEVSLEDERRIVVKDGYDKNYRIDAVDSS